MQRVAVQSARKDVYGELLSAVVATILYRSSLRMLRVVPAACYDVHARNYGEGMLELLGMLLGDPGCFPMEELMIPLPLSLARIEQVGLDSAGSAHRFLGRHVRGVSHSMNGHGCAGVRQLDVRVGERARQDDAVRRLAPHAHA
jgi:hypothetical protein